MPLIATEGETKPKQQAPAWTHIARCTAVVDIGTHVTTFAGKEKEQHKVRISWELPDEKAVFNEGKGEQPFVLTKEYTLSLYEKANLRHDLESWRGKAFTESELKGFDIFTLLGVPCLLTVIHKLSKDGGKTYANVSSVSRLAKGMTCPDQINPSVKYEIGEGESEMFDGFPEWLRKKIWQSIEFNGGSDSATPEREVEENGGVEIPF